MATAAFANSANVFGGLGTWQDLGSRSGMDPPVGTLRPRLLDVVRATLRGKHYSPRTEEAYVGWIRRFVRFHHRRHPRELGEAEVAAFLTSLAVDGHVAASTQNQAQCVVVPVRRCTRRAARLVAGTVRAKRPARLPIVLTQDEVRRLLSQLTGDTWLMASLINGAGLRLLECAELRVKDVDLASARSGFGTVKGGRTELP
jgi:integrase